jgi:hypothetical protein
MRAVGIALMLTLLSCGDDPAEIPPPPASCSATQGTLCDGNVLSTCIDGASTEVSCGTSKCVFVDDTVGSKCVEDPCALVGPIGVCADNAVTTCEAGVVTRTDCGDMAECRFSNGAYSCVDAVGTVAIRGQVKYEDRPPVGDGTLGPIRLLPARGVTVAVIDDVSKQAIGTALTSDNGVFVIHVPPTPNMIHVTAVAQSKTATRPMTVVLPNNMVHGFGSASVIGDVDAVIAFTVTDASSAAEAFNIFDQGLKTLDAVRRDLAATTIVPFTAIWSRGNTEGTFYGGATMYLLGESTDDDGYDDSVILHESGHYVEDIYGRTDSPGGQHDGRPTNPTLAWSEGFATFWACAVQADAVYSDSNAGGGFFSNIDTDVTKAVATSNLGQMVAEGMISEILWDLGDSKSKLGPDDDGVSDRTSGQVAKVQADYLRTGALRAVGTPGVDLVDFLDGWFQKQGLAACAGTRDIVTVKHAFPYDYLGPAGPCP